MWNLDENWVRYDDFKFRSRNFFASIQKIHGDLGLDNMIFEFYIERAFQRYIICKILRKSGKSGKNLDELHDVHHHLHEEDEDLHLWFARVLAWRTRAQACLIHGPHFDSCFRRFLEFIFHFSAFKFEHGSNPACAIFQILLHNCLSLHNSICFVHFIQILLSTLKIHISFILIPNLMGFFASSSSWSLVFCHDFWWFFGWLDFNWH